MRNLERGVNVVANPGTKEGQRLIEDHLEANGIREDATLSVFSVEDPEEDPGYCSYSTKVAPKPRMVHVALPLVPEIPKVPETALKLCD